MGEKYSVILHSDTEDGGHWVECPDIPGCSSQGDTVAEAIEMIKDAIKECVDVIGKMKQSAKTT
ncbi:MAG: type II toxin-antitoxin system HicB family antitoxin [Deltaproteobacteria bacterium]|nr:type II toxin-antitoxin system HicB family antitoxin [Deltaproteobacteria bacterium]